MAQLLQFALPERRSLSSHHSRIAFDTVTEDLRVLARRCPPAFDFVAEYVHAMMLKTEPPTHEEATHDTHDRTHLDPVGGGVDYGVWWERFIPDNPNAHTDATGDDTDHQPLG